MFTECRHLEIFELVRLEDERELTTRLQIVSHDVPLGPGREGGYRGWSSQGLTAAAGNIMTMKMKINPLYASQAKKRNYIHHKGAYLVLYDMPSNLRLCWFNVCIRAGGSGLQQFEEHV